MTLLPVEISDQPDSDSRLVVDSPLTISFGFVLPFVLVAVTICGVLVIPPRIIRLSQCGSLSTAFVNESLTQLSPWVKSLAVSLSLPNLKGPFVSFKSRIDLTGSKDGLNVLHLDTKLNRALTVVNGSSELQLFATEKVEFDTVTVTLSEIGCENCGDWILNWEVEGPLTSMISAGERLLLAGILIPSLVVNIVTVKREANFEGYLTGLFTRFTILYVDPVYMAQLFLPSPYRRMYHLIFRDLYFAALGFYALRIFAYFSPDDGKFLNFGFPGSIAIVILAGLLVQDFVFTGERVDSLAPLVRASPFDRLTISHCYAVSLLCATVICRAIQVRSQVANVGVLRYRYYTVSVTTFLFILTGLASLETFTDRLPDMLSLLTPAVVTAFALFLEHIHTEGEEFPYGEYPAKPGSLLLTGQEVELGADEDSGQIGSPSKTQDSEHGP
jgi:hypothetical protein